MAQLVNVAKLNVLYKQLIPKIADLDVIASIDKFLAASQEVEPSLVGNLQFSNFGSDLPRSTMNERC